MRLVTDSREQAPLVFSKVEGVTYETKGLVVGDYGCWHGQTQDATVFERKSLNDLFTSFSGERYEAERAKILRAKDLGLHYILAIEASATEVRKGHGYQQGGTYHEYKKPGISMIRQLMTLQQKYHIGVWFCQTRTEMAWMVQEYFLAGARMREAA